MVRRSARQGKAEEHKSMLTSGKVPLEKTLLKSQGISTTKDCDRARSAMSGCLHQKTGLSASTITNDHKFASNLSHLDSTRCTSQQAQLLAYEKRL